MSDTRTTVTSLAERQSTQAKRRPHKSHLEPEAAGVVMGFGFYKDLAVDLVPFSYLAWRLESFVLEEQYAVVIRRELLRRLAKMEPETGRAV
jgi:hypothetical protein